MGKRIIISEEEKTKIESLYIIKEEFNSSDGLVIAGANKYELYTDGTKRYYDGVTSGGGHKICASMGWPCQTVSSSELDPNTMKGLEQKMNSGESVVNYTTPKGKKIEFKKV